MYTFPGEHGLASFPVDKLFSIDLYRDHSFRTGWNIPLDTTSLDQVNIIITFNMPIPLHSVQLESWAWLVPTTVILWCLHLILL